MNKRALSIFEAITGSPYMIIAPGFRDVGRDELSEICKVLSGDTDGMAEKLCQLYKYAPETINLDKQDRVGNCDYFSEDLCKCYLPDSLNQCWYKELLEQKRENDRNRPEYILWRNDVFKRDDYTCQDCSQRGGELNSHHIKSYAGYPKLRLILRNGITLCITCHRKRHKKLVI